MPKYKRENINAYIKYVRKCTFYNNIKFNINKFNSYFYLYIHSYIY